jgi:predicted metal-dependent phosphoesterase TrpH
MTAFATQRMTALHPTQDALALRAVFETLTESSCPLSYNFHLHTTASDGQLHPEALAEQAITNGLQGFAITDHHSTKGFEQVQRYFQDLESSSFDKPLPHLWSGVEITAELLGTDVHILGYAFNPNHLALVPYLCGYRPLEDDANAAQVIEAIQQAGGIAVLAHPARYRRSHHELIPAAASVGIDGVEAFYAYTTPSPWQASPRQTAEVLDLAQAHQLLHTCGTDTHGLSILERL